MFLVISEKKQHCCDSHEYFTPTWIYLPSDWLNLSASVFPPLVVAPWICFEKWLAHSIVCCQSVKQNHLWFAPSYFPTLNAGCMYLLCLVISSFVNCDLLACIFPRSKPAALLCPALWLAHSIVCLKQKQLWFANSHFPALSAGCMDLLCLVIGVFDCLFKAKPTVICSLVFSRA